MTTYLRQVKRKRTVKVLNEVEKDKEETFNEIL